MYRLNDSLYISGLVNMASFNLGPSYVHAECFDLKDSVSEFAKFFKVPSKMVEFEEIDSSLSDFLIDLFSIDSKALDSLVHWLTFSCGDCTKIYTSKDNKLFDKLSESCPFFFLEDLFFIEFEKMAVCFLIGNDE